MDFAKFVSLIKSKSLYFSSIAELRKIDPYEGSYCKGDIKLNLHKDSYFKDNWPKKTIDTLMQAFVTDRKFSKAAYSKHIFANCWHINNYESMAMWKLYAENQYGVAIKSTVGRLKKATENYDKELFISKINYVDHASSKELTLPGNIFYPFVRKNISLKHENELRIFFIYKHEKILDAKKDIENHINVSIKPETLIEKVHISPSAPDWTKELVGSLLTTTGLKVIKKTLEGIW